jgi:hypothetical protein
LSLRLGGNYGLEYFEKRVLRNFFGPNVKRQKKTVKNYIKKNFEFDSCKPTFFGCTKETRGRSVGPGARIVGGGR